MDSPIGSIVIIAVTGQAVRMLSENTDFNRFSPFGLTQDDAYEAWRAHKLANAAHSADALMLEIDNPLSLTETELQALRQLIADQNMAVYRLADPTFSDKTLVHRLGEQLGLTHLDNNLRADEDCVTSLEVRAQSGNQYIPYTNRRLSWHTDGYYNTLDQQVRGVILHCVQPAAEGGENALIDHELLYIRLRDEDPELIRALMHPEAMTIPPNIEDGKELRPAQSGPIFSVEPATGALHMRYSARTRNIAWRDDEMTRRAADRITELLEDESLVIRLRLAAGQGLISNNVLHNRTGFEDSDSHKRLMYRARYFDRVA